MSKNSKARNHSNKETRIVIAGERFGFPYGSGASARVLAYSKAIMHVNAQVNVYCMNYTEKNVDTAVNLRTKGVYEKIPFEYTSCSPIRNPSFLKRRFCSFLGKVRVIYRIWALKPTAIIGYTKSLPNLISLTLASRLTGSKVMLEMCEITYKEQTTSIFERFKRKFRYAIVSCLSDGFIAISEFMVEHITKYYTKKKPILKIPILVDSSAFHEWHGETGNYITYLGNLNRIDEIKELLESFSLVSQVSDNVQLRIAGFTDNQNTMTDLIEFAKNTGISNKVIWVGMVKRENLASLLCSSLMLVLPRKRGLFSDAGFPTKLGEYLASGRPVVVTDIGEIGQYLINMKNSLIVEPGNADAFATAMKYLIDNPQIANEIGAAGKELAETEFDYRQQGINLVKFLVSN